MLRRQAKDTALLDAVDLQLLEAVERGLSWSALVQSTSRDPEEAAMRVMRLIMQGHLEGKPGEDSAPPSRHTPVTAPAPANTGFANTGSANAGFANTAVTRPVPSISGAPTAPPPRAPSTPSLAPGASGSSSPPGKTLPPNALAAREALLRELATRRSGTSYPPVSSSMRPSAPTTPVASGYYSVRPSGSSVPPVASERPGMASSVPPGRYSMQSQLGPSGTSSAPPEVSIEGADSDLPALIDEFARGSDLQRWCAARLHEAMEQERAGELQHAIAALQLAISQNSDPRLRAERDRLQARKVKATSGVYRARALTDERANRHKEAIESWRKVLEVCPDDVEAAVHAATCCMEMGDVKQAGQLARRAVELAPQNVQAHRLMLRFFRKTGMELNANREREILRKLAKY